MQFEAGAGGATVLVGQTARGKSTLLKLLGGALAAGRNAEVGYNIRVGYFSQHRMETLNAKHTVLQAALDMPNPWASSRRARCSAVSFRGDDVFKAVGVLSGGEKTLLALVKLLLDPPNLLLMASRPHLDIGSIDARSSRRSSSSRARLSSSVTTCISFSAMARGPTYQRREAHAMRRRLRLLPR